MADSLILMVLALVVFGPRRLPQIGRQIGKLMFEFRKASNDFKFQMEEELRLAEEADRRKKEEEERKRAAALVASTQASVSAPAPTTLEAQADIGAVESESTAPYPQSGESAAKQTAEAAATNDGAVPTIQPPSTGEPVSASRPAYFYPNAEQAPAGETAPDDTPADPENTRAASPADDTAAPTTAKEPVSQHG